MGVFVWHRQGQWISLNYVAIFMCLPIWTVHLRRENSTTAVNGGAATPCTLRNVGFPLQLCDSRNTQEIVACLQPGPLWTCKHDMRVYNNRELKLSWWLIRWGSTFLTDVQHFRCFTGARASIRGDAGCRERWYPQCKTWSLFPGDVFSTCHWLVNT